MGEFDSRNCLCIPLPFLLTGMWTACEDHAFPSPHPCCVYILWIALQVRRSGPVSGGLSGQSIRFWRSILHSPLAHTFKPDFSLFLAHRNVNFLLEIFTITWNRWLVIKDSHILEIRKIWKSYQWERNQGFWKQPSHKYFSQRKAL